MRRRRIDIVGRDHDPAGQHRAFALGIKAYMAYADGEITIAAAGTMAIIDYNRENRDEE